MTNLKHVLNSMCVWSSLSNCGTNKTAWISVIFGFGTVIYKGGLCLWEEGGLHRSVVHIVPVGGLCITGWTIHELGGGGRGGYLITFYGIFY